MKKIAYKQYMSKHHLVLSHLPTDIKDKIGIFKKMQDLESTIEDHDKQELDNRLTALDKEITADLKQVKPLHKKHNKDKDTPSKTAPKKEVLSEDQKILEMLIRNKKHKRVMLRTLRSLGFKAPLGKVTNLGKYRITRVSYCFYCYNIVKVTD